MTAITRLLGLGLEVGPGPTPGTLRLAGLDKLTQPETREAIDLAHRHKENILKDLAAIPDWVDLPAEVNFHWALIDGEWVAVPDDGRSLWAQHKVRPGVVCFNPMIDGESDEAFEAFLRRYGLKKRVLH